MTKLRSFIDAFLRALSILVIVIIILIGSFLIYYFVSIKIYEKKGANYKPPIAMYMIISKSMIPNINVYDVVVDQKVTNINNIKVNDVITFVSKSPMSYNYIVTHRVIDISKTSDGIALLTKGDNNKIADEAFKECDWQTLTWLQLKLIPEQHEEETTSRTALDIIAKKDDCSIYEKAEEVYKLLKD